MLIFSEALPRLREQVERDLAPPGLPRRKLLATLVRLLHVAHPGANHIHAQGHAAKAIPAGDERQEEEQGQQLSCEGTLHAPDYAHCGLVAQD